MKKIILFFCIFLIYIFFTLNKTATAADINYSRFAGTTVSGSTTRNPSWGSSQYGSASETNDGSTGANGLGATTRGTGVNIVAVTATHTFSSPHTITNLKGYFYLNVECLPGYFELGSYTLSIFQNGSWVQVGGGNFGYSNQGVYQGWKISTGEWKNVTAVSMYTNIQIRGNSQFIEGYIVNSDIREIEAYGPPYVDCGFKTYDGANVISIACEPPGTLTSHLRIYKGSTTYGFVLVNTSGPKASKFRIQTSSGVKALRKY